MTTLRLYVETWEDVNGEPGPGTRLVSRGYTIELSDGERLRSIEVRNRDADIVAWLGEWERVPHPLDGLAMRFSHIVGHLDEGPQR